MDGQTFLDNFGTIADAPDGVDRLRGLILNLAVRGRLVEQRLEDAAVRVTWSVDELRLAPEKLWNAPALDERLPNGWAAVPMAKLGTWGSGGTPTKSRAEYYGGRIPWVVIGDLNDGIVTACESTITDLGLAESSARLIPPGAVLIAMYGSIGKAAIAGFECASNQAIAHCIPDGELISTEFLFLMVRSLQPRLFSLGKGAAQQNISQTVLKHLQVGVPPVAEQQRIVAKVDELMELCKDLEAHQQARHHVTARLRASSLDALMNAQADDDLHTAWSRIHANWEALIDRPQGLEELRRAILQLAMNGRLVVQDPGDEPAAALIARIAVEHADVRPSSRRAGRPIPGPTIDSSNSQRLPTGWVWARFGDVAQIDSNLVDPALHRHEPHVAPDNIEKRTGRLLLPVRSIGDDGVTSSKHQFRAGQILYSKIRPNLSKAVIVDFDGLCSADMYPINAWIDRQFLHAYILSEAFVQQVTREDNRLAMPKVNQSQLAQVLVPVPPLLEQARIVAAVNGLLGRVNELEELFRRRALMHGTLASAMCNEVVQTC